MASPTQMRNAQCRSVTIEARFTASSRSSGSHREWTHIHGGIWREFSDDRNRRVFGILQPNLRALYKKTSQAAAKIHLECIGSRPIEMENGFICIMYILFLRKNQAENIIGTSLIPIHTVTTEIMRYGLWCASECGVHNLVRIDFRHQWWQRDSQQGHIYIFRLLRRI
jgi:hypothetical protein